jgi:hypothetical protein
MLSDFAQRKVTAAYGVLMPDRESANRATFVVDKTGKITYIEQGQTAVDITSTADACRRGPQTLGKDLNAVRSAFERRRCTTVTR